MKSFILLFLLVSGGCFISCGTTKQADVKVPDYSAVKALIDFAAPDSSASVYTDSAGLKYFEAQFKTKIDWYYDGYANRIQAITLNLNKDSVMEKVYIVGDSIARYTLLFFEGDSLKYQMHLQRGEMTTYKIPRHSIYAVRANYGIGTGIGNDEAIIFSVKDNQLKIDTFEIPTYYNVQPYTDGTLLINNDNHFEVRAQLSYISNRIESPPFETMDQQMYDMLTSSFAEKPDTLFTKTWLLYSTNPTKKVESSSMVKKIKQGDLFRYLYKTLGNPKDSLYKTRKNHYTFINE